MDAQNRRSVGRDYKPDVMNIRLAILILCSFATQAQSPIEQDVLYQTVDGVELRLDIATPEGKGPFPAVVCLHGGGWSMGSKRSFQKMLPQFAAGGYVAASIQYRLAPKFRFPAQIDDVRSALQFLRLNAKRWKIEPARIALVGASAGAHLALLAGFREVPREESVQAIIDISAPTDLRDWRMKDTAENALLKTTRKTSDSLVAELLGTTNRSDAIVAEASPILQIRQSNPPVLIFHWREDQAVAAEQAERLIEALKKQSIPHEVVWFEGKGHALNGPRVETIVPRSILFLNTTLGTERK